MPRPKAEERTILLDARAMSRALQRMAVEIVELAHGTDDLVLIGIQRRGVELAERIAKLIEKEEGVLVPRGALDITLYRDDLDRKSTRLNSSHANISYAVFCLKKKKKNKHK